MTLDELKQNVLIERRNLIATSLDEAKKYYDKMKGATFYTEHVHKQKLLINELTTRLSEINILIHRWDLHTKEVRS